ALSEIGIAGEDALKRFVSQPAERGQMVVARMIAGTQPGMMGTLKKQAESKAAEAELFGGAMEGMAKPEITRKQVIEELQKLPLEQARAFNKKVNEQLGGIESWLNLINMG